MQSVELAQTSGNRPDATLSHGKQQRDHKIQHQAYKNDQELHVLIVAELSFHAHFVALPSLRFTYGNHADTLAGNTSPIDGPGDDRRDGRNTPSIAELIANLYYGEAGIMTNAADDFDALFEEVAAQRTSASPSPATSPAAAPAPAAAASNDEDDLDSLFDQVSATAVSAAPVAAPAAAPAAAATTATAPAAGEEGTENGGMFERLGGIVRLLHDSLRELGYDKALNEASSQIVDAQDRLEYVATLTEQAANKVLNTLDEGMPAQDVLSKQSKDMELRWGDLFDGKLSLDEFKALAGDSRQFATSVTAATEAEKARLLEIMMAQDFQDITGQLIKKVVKITQAVEGELAQLLRDNAPPDLKEKLAQKQAVPEPLMQGPSVPQAALNQDNVDDLLADLGF
jgi:chemotaxis protein CheZ